MRAGSCAGSYASTRHSAERRARSKRHANARPAAHSTTERDANSHTRTERNARPIAHARHRRGLCGRDATTVRGRHCAELGYAAL